jgi:peptidoglycan/LPS O-acetylase OafA/YrhL
MEILLLFGLLLVPVLLAASPILLLTLKGRPDIARLYLLLMVIVQITLILTHPDQLNRAASWVLLLVGISLIAGCLLTWYKTRLTQWLKYSFGLMVINGLYLILAIPDSTLFG